MDREAAEVIDAGRFGRFAHPARLIVTALRAGPRSVSGLLDDVRSANGPIGPGSLYGAIARLERTGLIRPAPTPGRAPAYRLSHSEEAR